MDDVDHGKGDIKKNHAAALVRSKVFRPKVMKDKSKKLPRKRKHKNRFE